MSEKSRTSAMILSFLFTGMGFVYLGNAKKGIGLFAIGVICNLLGMFLFGFFHYISILTWIVSLYLTYKEPIITNNEMPIGRRHVNRRSIDNRIYFNRVYDGPASREYVNDNYHNEGSLPKDYYVDERYERVHGDERHSNIRYEARSYDNEEPVTRQYHDNRKFHDEDIMSRRRIK